ncbi:MAG: type III-B CRISPR-associated protein Cas10/Cmr2 [Limnospira sp. PMC 894.15]|uniref:type III-B CRISPR-associated protein Cas10/Cmr2 n=1 Tax=Limnospira TaxID=2596745 RepID=UPI0028E11B15|nr:MULTISPECIES: type III-B CRISPR-associated protein Cas10/Cmr2 [unclassified Limnospira]MDT9186763.1 type III-B CRISPR-associated protein Cas10/Cmr2 [Limnospira sp. PMC 894.15]MDT9233320.1 type III-B CRISPR-associated protein Cas10/Cmr2 [Limnospira sp. PMC 917.15]MDT9276488.1 type III-B CRISPR-associated protein Cas10/Cmr2 [Limnospira sp. PMC 737.11]MDY7055038.1 type III-B CRISPR-associated protein Cas10/Cmr2 [Limnospira fusiformis LS22]
MDNFLGSLNHSSLCNIVFLRKLCALVGDRHLCNSLDCLKTSEGQAALFWWEQNQHQLEAIASSSDRVNLEPGSSTERQTKERIIKHPISAQQQTIQTPDNREIAFPQWVQQEQNPQNVFNWLWRMMPELRRQQDSDALLDPQHYILPDCPIHSYRATVSAIAGAVDFDERGIVTQYPYLLLFTFSPIQDFIKASRKFLDFWAGSYLLHYLSAQLCWFVAETYGVDAVITPSLWGQEIIDALLLKTYPIFRESFQELSPDGTDPLTRFNERLSTTLATAGFPNTITILVGSSETAQQLGETLCEKLRSEWSAIAQNIREGIPDHPIPELRQGIRDRTIAFLQNPQNHKRIEKILEEFSQSGGHDEQNRHDLENWKRKSCWEWRGLWNAQIDQTWQPYWTAVPLGDPNTSLMIEKNDDDQLSEDWIKKQEKVAQTRVINPPPTTAEKMLYTTLNNGTWWGSIQSRCGQAIQAIKNTRTWAIPISPGVRSTLSGQLSALHPQFRYSGNFREGYGLPIESMRLFWRLIAEVYPGLFDGSEMLNALELTKRMAWVYGGVGESLGIDFSNLENEKIDYSQLIRFPNLSSIASARFAYQDLQQDQNHGKLSQYWQKLQINIKQQFGKTSQEYQDFLAQTRGRPFHIPKTDICINRQNLPGRYYNGVMFSSKWLAEDMGLEKEQRPELRKIVDLTHSECGFGDSSPADWWVIVLGDGDGMGQYVSGKKLHSYQQYLTETHPEIFIDRDRYPDLDENQYRQKKRQFIKAFRDDKHSLLKTRKRMGPATHVGLNRALLDFSNRLVPFITEKRFCGRVVYSGGDDVMTVLPLEDLPDYLLSLRAAWCGGDDPYQPQAGDPDLKFQSQGGYWRPTSDTNDFQGLPDRSLFTMGFGATMSLGIVIVDKSVPLPVALEALWEAESDRAKELSGGLLMSIDLLRGLTEWRSLSLMRFVLSEIFRLSSVPNKNGLCFRVLYSSGNTLEALIKGELYAGWRDWITTEHHQALSSLLYRLAEELPRHADLTPSSYLIAQAARAIALRRDDKDLVQENIDKLLLWLRYWEDWARSVHVQWLIDREKNPDTPKPIGIDLKDLSNILRFSAFWLDKMQQRQQWHRQDQEA